MPFRGDRLRERREAVKMPNGDKMSQTELGALAGTSQSIIFRYEKNEHSPNSDTLDKLADAVQTSTDYLLGRTDDPSPKPKLGAIQRRILDLYDAGEFPELFELLGKEANTKR